APESRRSGIRVAGLLRHVPGPCAGLVRRYPPSPAPVSTHARLQRERASFTAVCLARRLFERAQGSLARVSIGLRDTSWIAIKDRSTSVPASMLPAYPADA